MPEEVERRVDAIVESCMEEGDKTEKECRSMAWATVNSDKKEDKKEEE